MSGSASSSSSSSLRVSEIFSSAGVAFNQLGDLTAQLSSAQHNPGSGAAKWTEDEVDLLHRAVTVFANDLSLISERIKDRTVGQIKTALKKKAFEDAGLPLSAQTVLQMQQQEAPSANAASPQTGLLASKSSADVTLNMLNASESEVDVEGLGDNRLDFGSAPGDVKM